MRIANFLRPSKRKTAVVNIHLSRGELFEHQIKLEKRVSLNPQETENNLRSWEGYHVLHSDGSLKRGYDERLHCFEAEIDFGTGYVYLNQIAPFLITDKNQKRIELKIRSPIYTLPGLYSEKNGWHGDTEKIKALKEEMLKRGLEGEIKRIEEKLVVSEKNSEKLKRLLLENRYKRHVLS